MSFIITCPVCGRRNSYEFRFGGEERGSRPDEEGLTPAAWCDYVHMRSNVGGAAEGMVVSPGWMRRMVHHLAQHPYQPASHRTGGERMRRLPQTPTQRINLTKKLGFSYRGKALEGVAGDTVASALHANGVRIFSRSIKYHRPRGLYSLDGQCSNCLMEIDGLPNMRAETTVLREGMTVSPQNVLLSPEFDPLAFMDKLDWAMPAGFYYRMFHKPYRFWPFFQNRIRKMGRYWKDEPELAGEAGSTKCI